MNQSIIKQLKSINTIFNLFLFISLIVFYLCENYNRVLPNELILISYIIIFTLVIIGILSFKWWSKLICIVLILVASFLQFYVQNSLERLLTTYNFDSFETLIVVKKETPYLRLEQLLDKKIMISNNLNQRIVDDNVEQLKKEINNFILINDKDDTSGIELLLNGDIDALLLSESSLKLIEETNTSFKDNYRIIDKLIFHKPREIKMKPVINDEAPFTVFISGIDVTGPINTVSRSDVNIVMAINPKERKIVTVSIPRDTYIPIPCINNRLDKLTHAGNHGVACSIDSVSKFLGLDIHYYVRVNFTSVLNIVKLFESLDVYSHYDFIGYQKTHFTKGINTMTPEQVLEFARTRKTVAGGDITRGVHQQEIMKSLFKKILSPNSVFKLESVISSISKSIDTNFDANKLSNLIAIHLADPKEWQFDSFAIDGDAKFAYVASYSASKLSIMLPYEKSIKEGLNKLRSCLGLDLVDKVPYVPYVPDDQ